MNDNYTFDPVTLQNEVYNFVLSVGINPVKEPKFIFDGKMHRFSVEGDKNGETTGWYVLHEDGWPAGAVGDWRKNIEENWNFDKNKIGKNDWNTYFSGDKFKKANETFEKRRNERKKQLEQAQAEASTRAFDTWRNLPAADSSHPYFVKKQIDTNWDIKYYEATKSLAIPLYNTDGDVKSIQWIDQNGSKKFFYGVPTKELFWQIGTMALGERDDGNFVSGEGVTVLLGEGVATVAKVYQLTNMPCISAMNCGGLRPVAEALKAKYPKLKIIILADNDKLTELKTGKNPGIEAAKECVEAGLAEGFIAPPFLTADEGSDWDDFAIAKGAKETERILNEKILSLPLELKRAAYLERAKKLGLLSGASFEEFCKPTPGNNWIIQDWLPSESLMMLFAPSGSGKGFVAVDMAFAVACPYINMWHDKKVVEHGDVVYLAGEGQKGLRKRSAGLKHYKNMSGADVKIHFIDEAIPLDDKNPEIGVERMIANIGCRCPNPKVVFIDTTNCYMSGDENKTVDATAFVRACKQIMSEFHCTVIIIHHTGLGQDTQGRARGSSVFKAAMDMELKVSKSGMMITLEMTKSKDTELQKGLTFQMKVVDAPGFKDAVGQQDTTCVLLYDAKVSEQQNAISGKPEKKMTKSERFARETYRDAAKEYGEIITNDEGQEVVALNIEDWRKVFYAQSAADNNDAKRAQFSTARKTLLEDKKVVYKFFDDGNEFYCLKPDGSTFETDIIITIKRGN